MKEIFNNSGSQKYIRVVMDSICFAMGSSNQKETEGICELEKFCRSRH